MQELKVENFAPLTHMDGVLLSFLRAYFQYHPEYSWDEDDAKTKIKISDAFVEVGNESDFTPRIIIRRGNFSLTNPLVVGNYSQSGKSLMSWTQERERNYVAGAVYQISIITKLPLESLNLAEEISSTILMYTERLAEYYNVHIEQHIEVSPENIKTSGTDIEEAISNLTVLASYKYMVSTNIVPRYEKLKGIDIVSETDRFVEKNNKLQYQKLKFNTQVDND